MNFSPVILGYLFGSVASAIIVCRVMGLGDPRSGGSGNPGATNVLRLYGKKAAAITLAGDMLKGVIPVIMAKAITAPDLIIAMTGMAAFLGHLYPVFFNFKGGKGVATFVGVLIGTNWLLGLAFITTWLLIALLFRYSSLSAVSAAVMTPLYAWYLTQSPSFLICFSLMSAVLIWRHQSNIKKLIAGNEDRIGSKKGNNAR